LVCGAFELNFVKDIGATIMTIITIIFIYNNNNHYYYYYYIEETRLLGFYPRWKVHLYLS